MSNNSCRVYYYPSSTANKYIDIPVTNWKEDNYGLILESFMGSANRNIIFSNLVPGAVKESFNILGTPHFRDLTYSSGNSLILSPIGSTGLSGLRQERTIAVSHLKDDILTPDLFYVRLEGKRIDV